MYEIETNVDAYVRGFLEGTLVVYKKKSPANSATDYYYQIFDQDGLIEIFYTEEGLLDLIEMIKFEVVVKYSFSGDTDKQVSYEYD